MSQSVSQSVSHDDQFKKITIKRPFKATFKAVFSAADMPEALQAKCLVPADHPPSFFLPSLFFEDLIKMQRNIFLDKTH